MRVSIWYSTGKILVLCRDGTNTIDWVIAEFVKKLERRMHLPAGSVKVKWLELTASADVQKNGGEYKLASSQIIKDVVEDGGDLVAITEGPETGKSAFCAESVVCEEEKNEVEGVKTCVQCGAEYRESENAMGSCRFHQVPPRKHLWGYVYDCCDQEEGPCKVGQHRSEHHADYPYERFKAWEDGVASEVRENWTTLSRIDYENGAIRALKVDLLPKLYFFVRVYTDDKVKFVKVVEGGKSCSLEWSDGPSFRAQVAFTPERKVVITFVINMDTVVRTLTYTETGALECVHEEVMPERAPLKFAGPPSDFDPERVAKVRRGKTFESLEVPSLEMSDATPAESGSASGVSARWIGSVLADQDTFAKDGKLGQYFISNYELANNSDADVTIGKIDCRIANEGAEPLPCSYCFSYVGVFNEKTGRYYFPEDGGLPLTLPAHTPSFRVAVSSKFLVAPAKPSKTESTRKRAHLSLPQPLRLEHTFLGDGTTPVCGPVASVQVNPALEYPTQESFAASHPELRVLYWTHCDNFCDASRKWFALCLGPLGELLAWSDAGYTVLPDSLWSWAVGKRENNNGCEVVIPFFEKGTEVFALVNTESGAVWGLRVRLSTDTGFAEDVFQIPDVAEMRKSLKVAAAKKDGGNDGTWEVSWKFLAGCERVKVCSQVCEVGYGNAAETVDAQSECGSAVISHPYVYVYNEDTVKYDTTSILKIKC